MDANTSEERNPYQIIRKDSRGSFVEVQNDWFASGKAHIQFVAYDKNKPKGQRATSSIHIFMDIAELLLLAEEAANGLLHKRMQKAKEDRSQEPLYECLGGTTAARLSQYGQPRSDGKSLSRVAKLIAGERCDYLFVADSGPGEPDSKGLIVPRFGRNPEQHVSVSLSWRDLSELLIVAKTHYCAWLSAQYLFKGSDSILTQDKSRNGRVNGRDNGRVNGRVDADDMKMF